MTCMPALHWKPNAGLLKSRKGCWILTSIQCLRASTHGVIPSSPLCFKRGFCWFLCYFWQSGWLVGTSLSETCETRNARGTVMSTWSLSPENRAASVWRLALPGSSTLRAAGLLCPSRTPIHHFLLLFGHQQAGFVQQVDLLPLAILKRTTFHLFYFVMLEGRAPSMFSVTGRHTQTWLLWRLYWWSSQHRHDLS